MHEPPERRLAEPQVRRHLVLRRERLAVLRLTVVRLRHASETDMPLANKLQTNLAELASVTFVTLKARQQAPEGRVGLRRRRPIYGGK